MPKHWGKVPDLYSGIARSGRLLFFFFFNFVGGGEGGVSFRQGRDGKLWGEERSGEMKEGRRKRREMKTLSPEAEDTS